MIPRGIDDEYDYIRTLHESAATAVLLVSYKPIGDIRILKLINRNSPESNSILSEANLLQGFKSPQIPTIYSVGKTADYYYLVEEYVKGHSLHDYLQDNRIDKNEVLKIAISICDIIEMLHTAGSEPVLYRDMKPEHVMITGEIVKLIDFGISLPKSKALNARAFGTKTWAAPEQLKGEPLDERCDIYSVGRVVEYMLEKANVKEDHKFKNIIARATATDKSDRYASIGEFKKMLQALRGVRVRKFEERHLNKKIAIIGTDKSVGCTHIAMCLCTYFNSRGINCYYKDMAGDETVKRLKDNLIDTTVKEGVLYHKKFRGIIDYGPAVKNYEPPNGLWIMDYGKTDIMPMAEDILLITCPSPWKDVDNFPEWVKDDSVRVIMNFAKKSKLISIAKNLCKRIYVFPESTDIFRLSKSEEKLFSAIFKKN